MGKHFYLLSFRFVIWVIVAGKAEKRAKTRANSMNARFPPNTDQIMFPPAKSCPPRLVRAATCGVGKRTEIRRLRLAGSGGHWDTLWGQSSDGSQPCPAAPIASPVLASHGRGQSGTRCPHGAAMGLGAALPPPRGAPLTAALGTRGSSAMAPLAPRVWGRRPEQQLPLDSHWEGRPCGREKPWHPKSWSLSPEYVGGKHWAGEFSGAFFSFREAEIRLIIIKMLPLHHAIPVSVVSPKTRGPGCSLQRAKPIPGAELCSKTPKQKHREMQRREGEKYETKHGREKEPQRGKDERAKRLRCQKAREKAESNHI